MRSYGQFCPIARASEILSERWTLVILRNLLYGCTTFSELAAGAPGLSRTLLSKRLHQLQRAAVIEIRPKPDGNGSLYELTASGRELWGVLQSIGDWGLRWLEVAPANSSPDVVLWAWCTGYLRHDRLPDQRVVVRFDFPGQPSPRTRLWLLIEHHDAELCHTHPGFEEDLVVVVQDAGAFARWHLGEIEWGDALRAGHVQVVGPRHLARALPTWNRRRAPPPPAAPHGTAGVTPMPAPASASSSAATSMAIPGFEGQLVAPGDDGYDAARTVWNGAIDRRPALIARCTSAGEVAAALRFARERQLALAVRGGGHGVAGSAVCDDGLVIDLSLMRDVRVEPRRRTVRAGGGVLWGEVDAATQAFGLATTGGMVSHTGIGGLTLGGGIGWLMRRHGLTVDNLASAEVVTAEGTAVTASERDHPDLFWALRGGGGNLGVVTSFTYRLHPVGPQVLAGSVLWPLEDGPQVLACYRDYVAGAPPEVASIVTLRRAPPLPALPIELHGRPVCMVTMCFVGDAVTGERALRPLRSFGRPFLDLVGLRPYTGLQSLVDATVPHGWHYYWKSANLPPLDDALVHALVDHSSQIRSPWSYAVLFHLGGAVAEVAEDATAYSHRQATHNLNVHAAWLPEQPDGEDEITWARRFFAAVAPRSAGAYVNFLDHDDHDRVRSAYGPDTYRRLRAVKERYDPDGVFRGSHPPPPPTRRESTSGP